MPHFLNGIFHQFWEFMNFEDVTTQLWKERSYACPNLNNFRTTFSIFEWTEWNKLFLEISYFLLTLLITNVRVRKKTFFFLFFFCFRNIWMFYQNVFSSLIFGIFSLLKFHWVVWRCPQCMALINDPDFHFFAATSTPSQYRD